MMMTSYFTPSVLPWRPKPVRMTECTTVPETQLKVLSYGWYDSLNISVYSRQLSAICLKRRLLGECIGVINNLIGVK